MILTRIRALAVLTLLLNSLSIYGDEQQAKRLEDAVLLIKQLEPQNNKYVFGGNLVTFGSGAEMKADCSGFLNALLRHSDGFDTEKIRAVFGSTRPTAKRYFDAIAGEKGFENITKVEGIRSGDIIAMAYVKNYKGRATGHVMLAAGNATRIVGSEPIVEGTTQWQVPVIDSAINGHGPTDTRLGKGEGGKNSTGVGKGVLRVYADRDGKPAGYTWSNTSSDKSSFYSHEDRPLVIGRLKKTRP